jgi:hypothetical protein
MPIFKPQAALAAAFAAEALGGPDGGGAATAAASPVADGHAAERNVAVVLAIVKVLFRIGVLGCSSLLLARIALSHLLRWLVR